MAEVVNALFMPIADFCSRSKLTRKLGFEDSKKKI